MTAQKEFKACMRTVKRALNDKSLHTSFNEACKTNKMLAAAFKCYQNRNREHLELNFKWYRK
jgi:hypothetical protein